MNLEERRQAVHEQNKLLDELHNSVLNTRNYALRIGDELTEQDRMLTDLGHGVDRANDETQRQQRSIGNLLRDTKNGGFYTTVLILVGIIVVLLLI